MQTPQPVKPEHRTIIKDRFGTSWMITVAAVAVCVIFTIALWAGLRPQTAVVEKEVEEKTEVPAALSARGARFVVVPVVRSAPTTVLSFPGTVEANQQQLQQITPLVTGRVAQIHAAVGDFVRAGTVLLDIDSPQVAELHGKLHEAETRLKLAKLTLNRVQQSANRVSVLKAKATLTEAESTLARIKQLNQEGISARKDVVAAEAEYERAKADYNFQKDISLNKEVAEARAEYATAQTEAEHIKDGLRALDAHLPDEGHKPEHDISAIQLRAPISGTVIERFVNAGAGFEQGKPLLTIANTSTLWVVANVPDQQLSNIRLGMTAQVRMANETIPATVNYIDPRLNEDTRTGRVRLTIPNSQQRIKVGSFVDVGFNVRSTSSGIFVPSQAVQQVNDKSVVFVRTPAGKFEAKDVTVGPENNGLLPIMSGLNGNELVVTEGAFVLKSQMLKGQMGDDD